MIVLDSMRPGTHAGEFCERRAAWLRRAIDGAGGRAVYLFMHHPPFRIGIPLLDCIRLLNPEPLVQAIGDGRQVKHLFLGHAHRPISGSWNGISYSMLRGTNHQVPLDFESDDCFSYCNEPPSYGVAFLNEGTVVVHNHDFMSEPAMTEANRGESSGLRGNPAVA